MANRAQLCAANGQCKGHAIAPFEPRCYGLEPKWLRNHDDHDDNNHDVNDDDVDDDDDDGDDGDDDDDDDDEI